MIDTQAIRSKILDLAMRGKLTEQLPEDGTAEELLVNISKKKKEIEKSGALKGRKKKTVLSVQDTDIPFDIPETWKWIRLEAITEIFGRIGFRGYTKDDIVEQGHGAISLSPSNITKEGKIIFKKNTYISWEKYEESQEIMVNNEDILIVKTGSSYGKCAVVKSLPGKATINPQLAILKYVLCDRYFLHAVLNSSLAKKQYENFVIGAATPTFSQEDLANFLLPLPPLAEQKRIVERIELAFSVLDTIDALQAQYADNLTVLKSKLIDAAIQGKLTEQLPEDGTAEELYQQIQTEKQALIKAGKIKKEKPLPEITKDEIPFEIPNSWKWIRIVDLFNVGTGLTPLKSNTLFYENAEIPWVTSALTSSRYIIETETSLSKYAIESTKLKLYPKHTLIIAMYGEGKTRGQISELLIPATINQACAALESIVYYKCVVDFVYYFFRHSYEALRNKAAGSNQPNLSLQKIKETLIPLPPLAEQKRIVERLDRLLSFI